MHRTKWIMWVLVSLAAVLIVWRVGFYSPEQKSFAKEAAGSESRPNSRTAAVAEQEKPHADAPAKPAEQTVAHDAGAGSPPSPDTSPSPAPAEPVAKVKPEKEGKLKSTAQDPNQMTAEPNMPKVASESWEAVNLKDVEMKLIIQKIADWTGKVVIPADAIMKEKITIYAPGMLPRREALEQIYGALRIKGYTAEHTDKTIYLRPISDARIGTVPTVAPDQPLAAIENKEQIVQKFFRLANYSPSQMAQIVQPLVGEYGHISADESTASLFIIDTVRNLMRIETIIAQFDVAEAQQLTTEVFEVRNRAPGEIVQLLQVLLSGSGRGPAGSGTTLRTVLSAPNPHAPDNQPKGKGRKEGGAPATSSVVVGGARSPMMLIPEPKFSWIIAKAAPEDMLEIRKWIQRLDQPIPTIAAEDSLDKMENRNQVVQRFIKLEHASAERMLEIILPFVSSSGQITPEENTGTLLIIDTVENLLRVEKIIAQFDVPQREETVTQVFELQHREPEEIVGLLSAVLADNSAPPAGQSWSPWRDRDRGQSMSARTIRIDRSRLRNSRPPAAGAAGPRSTEQPVLFIPEPRRKWIIVKALPEDIEPISEWIKRLDKPVPTVTADHPLSQYETKNQVVQKFVKLEHCDPARMSDIIAPLLTNTGHVTAVEGTTTLMLIDTVENLIRIEGVIAQFDVAEADTGTQIFEVHQRTPEEIIALLETVLSTRAGASGGSYGGRGSQYYRPRPTSGSRTYLSSAGGRSVALAPESKQGWIIAKASPADMAEIGRWIERLDQPVTTVTANTPLSTLENKNQIVQRFVKLAHYDSIRMSDIVTPLLTEAGHVTAEESTGTLLLIDTVENLIRIEAVISQFDVAEADVATEIFHVRQRSPDEIIVLLETVLSQSAMTTGGTNYSGRNQQYSRPRPSGGTRTRSTGSGGATSAVIVGAGGRSIVLVPESKQGWIIAKASPEDINEIGRWIERLDRAVVTVTDDTPLSSIENKNQVVQRCIKLHSYSASQMGEIVVPLLSESGYVSADETTGNLLLIDTVENLIRIEAIVAQFDVPEAEKMATQIFEIVHADPAEVVQLLRLLLSDGSSRGGSGYGGGYRPSSRGYSSNSSRLYRGGMSNSAATSVIMGPSQFPVVLIPEPRRKWIIARASAEDMQLITGWIGKLDKGEPVEREYETVPITYADVREVATRINEALQQMPGTELQASVLVQALEQARQVMVFGRQDLRETVKKLIKEIDVPPGQFETQHFQLRYGDPDQIKRNIDELFGEGAMTSGRSSTYRPYTGRAGMSADIVKTMSHVALKQVTVIASPENMKKIGEQIVQWDVAIDVNEVKPRIVELRNSDPAQMATLLKTLFSQEMSSRYSFFDYLFGSSGVDKRRIVGPLYGQLTFEQVTGSKKLVVISNTPGAYDVVEDLIRELDSREAAEIPKVVRLNYADPETLAERLNAMFNEQGTSAAIHLSRRGLSDYSMDEGQTSTTGGSGRPTSSSSSGAQTPAGEYRPWWTTGRGAINQLPISNIIGRVRFIPDTHSKSILVLSPPEFMENLEGMIKELDIPGRQVMLKAIIIQVDHQTMTSLGVQLSSDAAKWETLDNENAIVARNMLTSLEQHGSLVIDPKTGVFTGTGSLVQINANLNVLIDFLIRELDAKILNQQTLWTKDNEEAQFFKGQRVGFQTRVSISDTGGRATSDFEYEKVGMTLRARPSITPEKNVDMIINVILSQLTSEVINSQRVRTELDTTTNMIVQDGQTIMLGGMLFQEDSRIRRKVPLLGDLPLVGMLFRHKQATAANSELLIFVTPYVIETPEEMSPEARRELEQARRKLDNLRKELGPPAEPKEPNPDDDTSEPPAQAPARDTSPAVTGDRARGDRVRLHP